MMECEAAHRPTAFSTPMAPNLWVLVERCKAWGQLGVQIALQGREGQLQVVALSRGWCHQMQVWDADPAPGDRFTAIRWGGSEKHSVDEFPLLLLEGAWSRDAF